MCTLTKSKNLSSREKFDSILLYSVLHYTTEPKELIKRLADQLNHGGRLLIGDLPNVNKKGRFVSTEFGRNFEAEYFEKDISEIKTYKDHYDYVNQCTNQNKEICDDIVMWMMTEFRNKGFNVFVTPQPLELPYSHTREDVIIEKY